MLFRDGGVVGDCVGLTSPRRSCKDGSVVFGVCVVLTQAEKKMKKNRRSAYFRQRVGNLWLTFDEEINKQSKTTTNKKNKRLLELNCQITSLYVKSVYFFCISINKQNFSKNHLSLRKKFTFWRRQRQRQQEGKIGSLSSSVFERRTSTGSGLFASLGNGLVETLR